VVLVEPQGNPPAASQAMLVKIPIGTYYPGIIQQDYLIRLVTNLAMPM